MPYRSTFSDAIKKLDISVYSEGSQRCREPAETISLAEMIFLVYTYARPIPLLHSLLFIETIALQLLSLIAHVVASMKPAGMQLHSL